MEEIRLQAIEACLIGIDHQRRTVRKVIDEFRSTQMHMEMFGWVHPKDPRGANLRFSCHVGLPVSNWSSPFPLSPELQKLLEAAGLQRHKGDPAKANGALLLIYRHPASILEHWRDSDAKPLRISMILKGYQQLLSQRDQGTLVADWRLEGLNTDQLIDWSNGTATPGSISELPGITPLARLVLVELLRAQPSLISVYQDLELHAELFGTQADSDLLQRLRQPDDPDALLQTWCTSRRSNDSWESDDQRLRRLEEDLEHYVLLSREQNAMLSEQQTMLERTLELASDRTAADQI